MEVVSINGHTTFKTVFAMSWADVTAVLNGSGRQLRDGGFYG